MERKQYRVVIADLTSAIVEVHRPCPLVVQLMVKSVFGEEANNATSGGRKERKNWLLFCSSCGELLKEKTVWPGVEVLFKPNQDSAPH